MSFLFSLFALSLFSSCNVIQAVGGGETKIGDGFQRGRRLDAIAYFHFEENSTLSTFHSYDGNRALTYSGDTADISTMEDYGYALDCSNVPAPNTVSEPQMSLYSNEGYSLFFRMKPTVSTATSSVIMELHDVSGGSISLMKKEAGSSSGDDLVLLINGTESASISDFFQLGTWLSVGVVVDNLNNQTRLFLDGSMQPAGSFSNPIYQLTNFTVCHDHANSNHFTSGSIDSLGVWDRQLSVEEIKILSSNRNPYEN